MDDTTRQSGETRDRILDAACRLFAEKGYRGTNTTHVPGTGVGLYFAKMICDLHDIQIDINSHQQTVAEVNGVPYSLFQVILHIRGGT